MARDDHQTASELRRITGVDDNDAALEAAEQAIHAPKAQTEPPTTQQKPASREGGQR